MSVKLIDTHGEQSSNCHIVNIEFTRWEQIENLQYDNCTFIHLVYIQYSKYDKTIASCLKSISSPTRSLHHLNVSLLFDNPPQSPLYLDKFAMNGNQSVYKWTKNWGKTFDNPNDLFVRLDKKKPLKLLFQLFTRVRLERPNTLSVLRLIPHWKR